MSKSTLEMSQEVMANLNAIAKEYAKEFKYKESSNTIYNKETDYHPINRALNKPIRQVIYREEKDPKSAGTIETRQRFGNPRIGIYGPGKSWFVALEYLPLGIISECQIFYPKGFEMMPIIKKRIEDRWNKIQNEQI